MNSFAIAEEYKPGDRVVDANFHTGTITEVFPQGKIKFKTDGLLGHIADATRNSNEIFKAYPCVENICVGTRVVDSFGISGTIKEIFTNGKVKFELDGYMGLMGLADRDFQSLGYTIDCKKKSCIGSDQPIALDKKSLGDEIKIISKINKLPNKASSEILDKSRILNKDNTEDKTPTVNPNSSVSK
jgi:translation initiation factor IF-1